MVTEDYVSFEVAKLLKEKGFQAKCTACYSSDPSHTFELISGRINYCNPRFRKYKSIPPYNAPTIQMALKWLREVHNLYINIFVTWKDKISHYQWSIDNLITQDTIYDTPCLEKYEEACNTAIKHCLENLI